MHSRYQFLQRQCNQFLQQADSSRQENGWQWLDKKLMRLQKQLAGGGLATQLTASCSSLGV